MSSTSTPPSAESIKALMGNFCGRVLTPDSPGYAEAAVPFNSSLPSAPAALIQARTTHDVVQALAFAKQWYVENPDAPALVVRAGGHSFSGKSTSVGGLVIDVREMRFVQVDAESKTAWCGAGTLGCDLDAECGVHGLCTTAGQVSHTGVAGLTLGGGFGMLAHLHGLMLDNLLAAEVVVPSGEVVLATADNEHSELFWALRGAGTHFGVVTRFKFQLHDAPKVVTCGVLPFPAEKYPALVHGLHQWHKGDWGDKCYGVVALANPPPDHNPVALLVAFFNGTKEEARPALDAVYDVVGMKPFEEKLNELPYHLANRVQDAFAPYPTPAYMSTFTIEVDDPKHMAAVVEDVAATRPGNATLLLEHWHGKVRELDTDVAAMGVRTPTFTMVIFGLLPDPALLEPTRAWVKKTLAELGDRVVVSQYANYVNDDAGPDDTYVFAEHLNRLRAVKRRYDPENVIHGQFNIQPADE